MRKRILIPDAIYFFIMVSAIANIRYQLTQGKTWYYLFFCSILVIVLFDIIYIGHMLATQDGLIHISVCFAIFFVLYELIISYFNDLLVLQMAIRDIVPWPLTFAVLYNHIKENGIPHSYKKITIIGLALCCLLSIPNIQRHLFDGGRHGGVIFPVYYCFVFLGILLRLYQSRYRYVYVFVVLLLLFVSTKRAGVAITIAGIIAFLLLEAHIQGDLYEQRNKYFFFIVLLTTVTLVAYQLVKIYNISTLFRFSTVLSDEGSGRGNIWRKAIEYFQNSSLVEKVFGHGYHSFSYSTSFGDNRRLMAHNSYMETLLDYGVVGLSVIVSLSMYLFYKSIVMIKMKSYNAPVMAYSVIGLLVLGFFSYFFEQSVLIMGYIVMWSICLGDEYYQNMDYKNVGDQL